MRKTTPHVACIAREMVMELKTERHRRGEQKKEAQYGGGIGGAGRGANRDGWSVFSRHELAP